MNLLFTTLNARFSHSSLALRYLREYARQTGWSVTLKEFTINDQIDFILGEIYREKASIIGFSCYIWNIRQTLELCAKLKKVAPQTQIILGGPEVSYDTAALMSAHPYIDFIVRGEGEETFKALLNFFTNQETDCTLQHISGLTYRLGPEVCANPSRPLIADLGEIPSPYGEGADLAEEIPLLKDRLVYYETSRGCPFQCQYCLSSALPGVRYFPLARVKKELLALMHAGVKKIKFVDRTFNCHQGRAGTLFQFILSQSRLTGGVTSFHFEIGGALLDAETLNLLATAPVGLFEFEIGVQTLNAPTLKYIQRKNDWSQLQPAVQQLSQKQNIHLHLDLIAGLPFESYAAFRTSFNAVYALKPHLLQLGFLKLLKGTGLRERAADFGGVFSAAPPYAVLFTKDLSFTEMLRLQLIEDLVEKYYNSHRFRYALDFLLALEELTPFTLFESLSIYWEKRGLHRQAHSVKALYAFLNAFVKEKYPARLTPFQELLKFDYLLQAKGSAPLAWFPRHFVPDQNKRVHAFLRDKKNILRYLPHLEESSVRVILKRIQVAVFSFDVVAWIEQYAFGENRLHAKSGPVREEKLAPFFQLNIVLFDYASLTGLFQQASFHRLEQKDFPLTFDG